MIVAIWSPTWATNMWWLIAVAFFVVDPMIGGDWLGLARRGRRAE
jgi:hypothetical protein